ncbi:MAG: hypothetical protein ISS17_09580 [Bacteroidales bacterium]|nr:hypothetical protein [Bacteroidales bacterium]
MKKIILVLLVTFTCIACEKNEDIPVRYQATDAVAGFTVTYRNNAGDLITEEVTVASAEDEWNFSFKAKKGDIVYLSAIYKEITSGIKLAILIDGKVYKQASSQYDTINYVIVSGTVPY